MQTYIGGINNKVLPYSTRNYSQYAIIHHNGKECEKMCVYIYICVCINESLCCKVEINTTL